MSGPIFGSYILPCHWGSIRAFFIALWNGKEGKGPGGTKHMHDSVKKHCGQVHIINTEEIFKL